MLVLELKFWTTRNDLKLVGFFANSFLSSFSFFSSIIQDWNLSVKPTSSFNPGWCWSKTLLLLRQGETNEFFAFVIYYWSASDALSKICAKSSYLCSCRGSKIAWGWVLVWKCWILYFWYGWNIIHRLYLALLRCDMLLLYKYIGMK